MSESVLNIPAGRQGDDYNAEEALRRSLKELADIKFALDESAIVAITDQRGTINTQCIPTPVRWVSTSTSTDPKQLTDEDGTFITDEAGIRLVPDGQ